MRERKRGRRRTFQGGSFVTLRQQNVTGASHFGYIVSKSEYLRKVGTFSETGQVRGHREKENNTAEGNVKAGIQPPKIKVSGFSDPARMILWPLPRLPNTHSSYTQSCPGRALADGFENSSGRPKEDFTRVGFDGLSCP